MNGNFGQFRVALIILELVKATVCAENRQIEKRCQKKMTAVFQLYSKTELLEKLMETGLRSKFRAL